MFRSLCVILLMVALPMSGSVYASSFFTKFNKDESPSQIDGFDFNYTIEDGEAVGLLQAFDDGDKTYFHLKDPKKNVVVYMNRYGKREMATIEGRTPYLVIKGTSNKFVLQMDKQAALVNYVGNQKNRKPFFKDEDKTATATSGVPTRSDIAQSRVVQTGILGVNALTTSAQSDLTQGVVFNIPFKGGALTLSQKVKEDLNGRMSYINRSMHVLVRGRPNTAGDEAVARTRAYNIRDYLIANGVDARSITTMVDDRVKPGKSANSSLSEMVVYKNRTGFANNQLERNVENGIWSVEMADATVKGAIERWASAAGWQLSWELTSDFPITVESKVDGSFADAVTYLAYGLQNSEMPLQVLFYDDNRVVRVVPTGSRK